jgi:L-ascorbate metabolism protein UlaG (beta-lactamase superfamily)
MKKIVKIITASLLGAVIISATTLGIIRLNYLNGPDKSDFFYPEMMGTRGSHSVLITYIEQSGFMIETDDMRIYIDPYMSWLDEAYADKPADIIFLTHHHADHYKPAVIDLIKTEDTIIVAPLTCIIIRNAYNITAVVPGDTGTILGCEYEAFYSYNINWIQKSAGHCGYILDIEGYTFFHLGDSDNIPEYEEISKRIDIGFIPIGDYSMMEENDSINVIGVLKPKYVVPMHYWALIEFSTAPYEYEILCEEVHPETDVVPEGLLYLK